MNTLAWIDKAERTWGRKATEDEKLSIAMLCEWTVRDYLFLFLVSVTFAIIGTVILSIILARIYAG